MGHEVAPDLTARIGQVQIEQEARRLDAARAQEHRVATLRDGPARLLIGHAGYQAATVALEIMHHAAGSNVRCVPASQRQIGRVHAGLRSGAASLMAGAAIDAGLSIAPIGLLAIA